MNGSPKPARLGAVAAALALLAAAGCNWTVFADDSKKAPVRSVGQPASFKTNDFGQVLLPLLDGQGNAAAFAASSVNDTNVSLLTVDGAGDVANMQISPISLNALEGAPATAMAEVPGTSPTTLLLGTPILHQNQTFGRFFKMTIPDGTANEIIIPALTPGGVPSEPGLGRGVAAGRLAGVEATYDYIVGSDDHVAVLVDGAPNGAAVTVVGAAGCDTSNDTMQLPRYLLRRPLLAARLWADPAVGPTVQQLVVGTTHTTAAGTLSFFSVVGDAVAGFNLNCLATATAPVSPTGLAKPHFGTSLAAGDFDGDSNIDLLVGSPPQEAFVYFGPFTTGAVPVPVAIEDPTGVDFGYAVTALNIDGALGDEAVIGDPEAVVGGHAGAGHVRAYKIDRLTGTAVEVAGSPYADHAPENDANIGTSVQGLSFCTAAPVAGAIATNCPAPMTSRILMAGAANEVFIYFRVGDNIPPRVEGGKTIQDVRAP